MDFFARFQKLKKSMDFFARFHKLKKSMDFFARFQKFAQTALDHYVGGGHERRSHLFVAPAKWDLCSFMS